MGTGWSQENIATVAGLGAGVAVTMVVLAIIIYQFARFRKQQKNKAEEEELKKDRSGWQTRSMEVPYRLGEDVFPSTYPDYPEYPDYPIDYPVEYPVDYPDYPVAEPPRARFFPVEETPYPMRPCIQQPAIVECDCEREPQPEHRIIFEPATPPQPPPEPQPIVVYQPLPREPAQPPQREIIREIYFPSQPQTLPPPPPRERRGSWCGPPTDDWILVKKEVKKKKPKKRSKRVEDSDDDDDDSASSSSSEEEDVSPYNRRLMPYDLAMPRIQFPQMQVPPIYFVAQQPAPAPAPPPAPAPAPVPVPAPCPRNAFFAANVRRFDNRQYEEQEQRANVATESYDFNDCNF